MVSNSRYVVVVEGVLEAKHWDRWFSEAVLTPTRAGNTQMVCCFDQPALHGMLAKICNLGLPLVQVQQMEPPEADPPNEQ